MPENIGLTVQYIEYRYINCHLMIMGVVYVNVNTTKYIKGMCKAMQGYMYNKMHTCDGKNSWVTSCMCEIAENFQLKVTTENEWKSAFEEYITQLYISNTIPPWTGSRLNFTEGYQ